MTISWYNFVAQTIIAFRKWATNTGLKFSIVDSPNGEFIRSFIPSKTRCRAVIQTI